MARCYRLNGENKIAREYIDRMLNFYPYDGDARCESVLIYAENGKLDDAIKEIEKVFDIWLDADADHIKSNEAKLQFAEWKN